jgi:hypothetical protein
VLQTSANAKAVRTLDQQRPRMVKRRNSAYAPFKRPRTNVACDFTPLLSKPAGSRIAKVKRAVKNEFIGD